MTLYLIRHGKTRANEAHLYCGSTDLPLSEQGQRELEGLHYSLAGVSFVTSGLLRTEQTLAALFGPVAHRIDPDLREVDFGMFEMHSYDQLKDTPAYQTWLAGDNEANVPPGGESGVQMQRRVERALQRLLESDTDTVVIAHGGVIAAMMQKLFPQEGKNRYLWQPKPGRGYAIRDGKYWQIPEPPAEEAEKLLP